VPDNRSKQRFPLELPVRVRAEQSGAEEGVTGNVSSGGVYIRTNKTLKIGSEVEFDITLPAEAISGPTDVQIHCRGKVLRVERKNEGETGVACEIEDYRFVRAVPKGNGKC
jgi:hypothetical protein